MVDFTTKDIMYITAEAVVGFITVTGNIIVLVAIIRTKGLHTITNVFIGNLAMADIAVGFFVAPCAAMSFLGLPDDKYGCIFINCAILMFTNISILMLLTIAAERFIAIRFPFIYKRHATVKTAILVNLSIWLFGSILGLLPMFGWNKAPDKLPSCAFTFIISMEYMVYFQFFAVTLTPLIIILFIYLYIFFIVRQHTKQTRTLENLFKDPHNSSRHRRRWDKDVQAAKMFATLFLLFAIFWLPINIMNSITLFCKSCKSPIELLLTTIVLSHANSSVNPFLYAANNSRIKIAIQDMFHLKRSQENHFDSNSQAPTSHAVKENKANDIASGSGSQDNGVHNVVGQRDIVQSTGPHEKDGNVRPSTTTKVTFKTEPSVRDQLNETSPGEHTIRNDFKRNNQQSKVLRHTLTQTHSFRDEIDTNIFDRITPLEGIMANIYNSIDSETRDIIEGKGKWADDNTQINPCLSTGPRDDDASRLRSSCPPATSSGKHVGLVNHAFVDDGDAAGSQNKNTGDADISFIDIPEPSKCVINVHQDPSPPHSHTKSTTAPKLSRSCNITSTDGLSSSISQDSAVNIANDNDLSESTISMNTQMLSTPQSESFRMSTIRPLEYNSALDGTHSSPHSTTLQGTPSTTQNMFVMESENDDSIMSVKYVNESQDAPNSVLTCGSESPFDAKEILNNRLSEVTHL